MPTYKVHLADWDLIEIVDPSRKMLFNVTRKGEVVDSRLYSRPYRLNADNLEHVFEILNMSHPRGYNRRSLSIGDIVVDESGSAFVCVSIGWRRAHEFETSNKA